jgi:hypothetical protein
MDRVKCFLVFTLCDCEAFILMSIPGTILHKYMNCHLLSAFNVLGFRDIQIA